MICVCFTFTSTGGVGGRSPNFESGGDCPLIPLFCRTLKKIVDTYLISIACDVAVSMKSNSIMLENPFNELKSWKNTLDYTTLSGLQNFRGTLNAPQIPPNPLARQGTEWGETACKGGNIFTLRGARYTKMHWTMVMFELLLGSKFFLGATPLPPPSWPWLRAWILRFSGSLFAHERLLLCSK